MTTSSHASPIASGDHDEALRRRFAAGESDAAIGAALGASKTQVARRRAKLGLMHAHLSRGAMKAKFARVQAPKPVAAKSVPTFKKPFVVHDPASPVARKEAAAVQAPSGGILAFINGTLKEHEFPQAPAGAPSCKWPVGSKHMRNFRYCGASAIAGRAYCPHHYERSVTRPVCEAVA